LRGMPGSSVETTFSAGGGIEGGKVRDNNLRLKRWANWGPESTVCKPVV